MKLTVSTPKIPCGFEKAERRSSETPSRVHQARTRSLRAEPSLEAQIVIGGYDV